MKLWTIILLFCYSLVIILNLAFAFSVETFLLLLMCLAILMLPAAVFLFAGRALPKKLFSEKLVKVNKFEQKICKITNVKNWKDKIPVGGKVAGFSLNKLTSPRDIEFLERYIYESSFADWLHTTIFYWSFISIGIIALINVNLVLTMALPFAIIFAYQNITSSIIQWYMRPRIIKLRDSVKSREEKLQKTQLKEEQENEYNSSLWCIRKRN